MNDALHNKVVKFFYDYEELFIAIMNKKPYQSDGWDYEIEVVKEFLTANQHCYCGDITNLGVIHRDNGPCHYPENTSEYKRGYADAMNWKTQNHLEHLSTAQPEQEPVAMKFKIYKPTVPDPMRQGINNALLPWVYDQDRSSGFDASMWVTPVATLPPQRTWVGLTDEEIELLNSCGDTDSYKFAKSIEAKLKDKNL